MYNLLGEGQIPHAYIQSSYWLFFIKSYCLVHKVLKNGVEVKLQRNALSVLEHPTGNEVDEDHDFDSSSGSDIGEKDHDFCELYYFIPDEISACFALLHLIVDLIFLSATKAFDLFFMSSQ